MSTSMAMGLRALGYDTSEDDVNRVMGAQPMKGAAWEQALACAQHYGVRATLTVPATVRQLKEWTDAGNPVMIAWNPEGRDWSHASLVFDVTERPESIPSHCQLIDAPGAGLYVWVADPNLPNPEKTVRIVHEDEFYARWSEKWPNYLVRRPACCLEREITPEGRQVMASRIASRHEEAIMSDKDSKKNNTISGPALKQRDEASRALAEGRVNIRKGPHQNKGQRGQGQKGKGKEQRHPKHKNKRDMAASVALRWITACGDEGECTCGGNCGCGGSCGK